MGGVGDGDGDGSENCGAIRREQVLMQDGWMGGWDGYVNEASDCMSSDGQLGHFPGELRINRFSAAPQTFVFRITYAVACCDMPL